MTRDRIGTCDFCDDEAVMAVNGHKACPDRAHIDQTVAKAAAEMRMVAEAFDRHFPRPQPKTDRPAD